MAHLSATFCFSGEAATTATLLTHTSSAIITIGVDRKFAITATAAFNLRMANSATSSITAAAATDFEFPGSAVFTIETGSGQDSVYIYNPNGSSITYWLQPLAA